MNSVEIDYHDLLRNSERQIPQDIQERLRMARRSALSHSSSRERPRRVWLSFSGVALASLVALVLVWPELQPGTDNFPANDPLMSENLEMYQNLDFYYWLSQQGFSSNG